MRLIDCSNCGNSLCGYEQLNKCNAEVPEWTPIAPGDWRWAYETTMRIAKRIEEQECDVHS